MIHNPLILASTSETRHKLLHGAGLSFAVRKPEVDEDALVAANPLWQAHNTALHLALAKSRALAQDFPDSLIIGADQTVSAGGVLITKPATPDAARAMLLNLRGRRHTLRSAIACTRHGEILFTHVEDAHLTMRNFSPAFLDGYIASAAPGALMSAGGYRLEENGIQLFERIEGDYFTILGLPLLPLLHFLRTEGFITS